MFKIAFSRRHKIFSALLGAFLLVGLLSPSFYGLAGGENTARAAEASCAYGKDLLGNCNPAPCEHGQDLLGNCNPAPNDSTGDSASTTSPDRAAVGDTKKQMTFGEGASKVVSVFTPLVAFMSTVAGELLGNAWIYEKGWSTDPNQLPMKDVLRSMWTIIRDLVNYVFIVILVIVAFMNVVSAGSEMHSKFEVKAMLPKVVIALVAVNFTWFGAQIVLDVANVATHIVFGIPQTATEMVGTLAGSDKKYCPIAEIQFYPDPSEYYGPPAPPSATPASTPSPSASSSADNTPVECGATKDYGRLHIKWSSEPLSIFERMNGSSITELFAFGILHVERLPISISPDATITSIGINALISLALMVIILIVFVSMVIVLAIRIIMIWLNVILSPVFVLLPIVSELGISESENFGLKPFIKQAFIPAMMAMPLVIGLVMIIAGGGIATTGATTPGEQALGNIKFTGELINGIGNIQQAMWFVLAIIVMWGSVKVAEESGDFAKALIEPMSGAIKDGAKWVAKTPMFLPWIPVPSAKDENGNPEKATLADMLPMMRDMTIGQRDRDTAKRHQSFGIGVAPGLGMNSNVKNEIDKLAQTSGAQLKDLFADAKAGNRNPNEINARLKDIGGHELLRKASDNNVPLDKVYEYLGAQAGVAHSEYQAVAQKFSGVSGGSGTPTVKVDDISGGGKAVNIKGGGNTIIENIKNVGNDDWKKMAHTIGNDEQALVELIKELIANGAEKDTVIDQAAASKAFGDLLSDQAKIAEFKAKIK